MPIFQEDFQDDAKISLHPESEEAARPSVIDTGQDLMGRKVPGNSTGCRHLHVVSRLSDPPLGLLNSAFIIPSQITSDRVELIELLKRGENPTWLPNNNLGTFIQAREPTITRPPAMSPRPSVLQPPPAISEGTSTMQTEIIKPVIIKPDRGPEIARPRSALHSGDFTHGSLQHHLEGRRHLTVLEDYRAHTLPWLFNSVSHPTTYLIKPDPSFEIPDALFKDLHTRSKALSLSSSCSSGFHLKPPTSPLVQIESNDELEDASFHSDSPVGMTSDLSKNHRRHSLQTMIRHESSIISPNSGTASRPLPNLRRDNRSAYQAHQPRRSLTTSPSSQQTSTPLASPRNRPRRLSVTPDSSPALHASMVGSYEESILRGRMSTTPSKPLDFLAQIGVLGLDQCKPALRCPAHVTVPFPAVFYSYETTTHGRSASSEDGPSPYVGQIDLENSLPDQDEARKKKRRQAAFGNSNRLEHHMFDDDTLLKDQEPQNPERLKRYSTSRKVPPGGSYRLPEKGQLQIIIKNPNKTAVKLFLVPYDLTGMEPGTKTFIRQRSYTAEPLLDSTPAPSSRIKSQNNVDRATLRYLVHLHICCPSRGRYYLYKSIRVVFANRVPDGKEKLRNEISLPEPRFSIYRPSRELGGNTSLSLSAEKVFRRRSAGFTVNSSSSGYVPVQPLQPLPPALFQHSMRDDHGSGQRILSNQLPSFGSIGTQFPTEGSDGTSMTWISGDMILAGYEKPSPKMIGTGGDYSPSLERGRHIESASLLAKKFRAVDLGLQSVSDQIYQGGKTLCD